MVGCESIFRSKILYHYGTTIGHEQVSRQHIDSHPTIWQYPLLNYLGAAVDDGLVDENILQDLACEARKEIIPRFSRAKNVDNKWVYLAQLGHREFQEVEVIICRHPEQKCVNGLVHQIKHPNPESTNSEIFYEIERFFPMSWKLS